MRGKRIDPRDVKKGIKKSIERKSAALLERRRKEMEIAKDPAKHAAYVKGLLGAIEQDDRILRLPKRPLIAIDSDDSPMNTKFSDLFAKAREITAACEAYLKDENKSYMDNEYTELNKAFVKVAKEIKEKSASPEEAAVALVELFNYLTRHEKSNADCGYRLSCDLVNEILSIPNVDLDLVDQVLLAYVPHEIGDWNPIEFIGGDALNRLEARYVGDSKSGDKEKVEKAMAWAELFQSTEIH